MVALRLAATALALVAARPALADPVDRWRPLIEQASLRFGVPSAWIAHVMREESAGLTEWKGLPIRSSAGAIGLMQLMPATWAAMRARLGLGQSPDDPHDNIFAGALYLRLLYDRFGYPGLFAAYSCGPTRYASYLAGARALPGETIAYLGKLGAAPARGSAAPQAVLAVAPPAAMPSLFLVRHGQPDAAPAAPSAAPPPSLFAIRRSVP